MKNERLLLERLVLVEDLIVTQMNYWVLFPVAVTILGVMGLDKPMMWIWVLCGLLPFFFFLCRRYTNAFWLFMLVHLAGVMLFVLLPVPNIVQKILLMAAVAAAVIYSFYLRLASEERRDSPLYPVVAVGIVAATLLIQNSQGQQGWEVYYISVVIGYLAGYYVQFYIEQYFNFLIVNKSSNGNIPETEILHSGMGMTILYAAIGVLVLVVTANIEWLAAIMVQIKRFLLWLLRFLFRNVSKEEADIVEEVMQEQPRENLQQMFGETAETSTFWDILEKITMVVIAVALVVFLVYLVWKVITFLIERFGRNAGVKTVNLEHGVDVREKCEIEKRKVRRKMFPAFRTPAERIRRIYQKQVLVGKKQLIGDLPEKHLEYMTAKECGDGLKQTILTEIYEKARYSTEECTMEDVRNLKAGIPK